MTGREPALTPEGERYASRARDLDYREPVSAHAAVAVMFGRVLRGFHRVLALGEALALHFLESEGRVVPVPGADGVMRFVRP
jgi:hypothetical protein